jgi:hypothetical protein
MFNLSTYLYGLIYGIVLLQTLFSGAALQETARGVIGHAYHPAQYAPR